jgi:hypothetical protein
MSQWLISESDGSGCVFDDEQMLEPGEEGFSTRDVEEQSQGRVFTYLGRSPGYVKGE